MEVLAESNFRIISLIPLEIMRLQEDKICDLFTALSLPQTPQSIKLFNNLSFSWRGQRPAVSLAHTRSSNDRISDSSSVWIKHFITSRTSSLHGISVDMFSSIPEKRSWQILRIFTTDEILGGRENVDQKAKKLIYYHFADATSSDPTLQLLKSVIRKGWPEKRSQCPSPVKPF